MPVEESALKRTTRASRRPVVPRPAPKRGIPEAKYGASPDVPRPAPAPSVPMQERTRTETVAGPTILEKIAERKGATNTVLEPTFNWYEVWRRANPAPPLPKIPGWQSSLDAILYGPRNPKLNVGYGPLVSPNVDALRPPSTQRIQSLGGLSINQRLAGGYSSVATSGRVSDMGVSVFNKVPTMLSLFASSLLPRKR